MKWNTDIYRLVWSIYHHLNTNNGYKLSLKPRQIQILDKLLAWAELPFQGKLPTGYQLYCLTNPYNLQGLDIASNTDPELSQLVYQQLVTLHWNCLAQHHHLTPQHITHWEVGQAYQSYKQQIETRSQQQLESELGKLYSSDSDQAVQILESYHLPNYRCQTDKDPYHIPSQHLDPYLYWDSNQSSDLVACSDQDEADSPLVYDTHHLNLTQIWIDNDDQEVSLSIDQHDVVRFGADHPFRLYCSDSKWRTEDLIQGSEGENQNDNGNKDEYFPHSGQYYYICHLAYQAEPKYLVIQVASRLSCNWVMNCQKLYYRAPPAGYTYSHDFQLLNNRLILAQAVIRRFCWKYLRVLNLSQDHILVPSLSLDQIKSLYYATSVADVMIISDPSRVWETLIDDIGEILLSRAVSALGRYLKCKVESQKWYKLSDSKYFGSDNSRRGLRKWFRQDKDFALVALATWLQPNGEMDIANLCLQIPARKMTLT